MKLRAIITLSIAAVLVGYISYWMAMKSYTWFPPQAAAEAKLFDDLFAIFVGLGTFIYLGVVTPFLYSLAVHRASKYDMSDGPHIEGSVPLEVIWTAIPIVLVLTLSFVSYRTYEKMQIRGPMELVHMHMPALMEPAYAEPIQAIEKKLQPVENIDVVARQWAWIFHYPEQDVTSTELHIPVDRRIHLTLQSEDVLHGFYVPAFRIKQDVVPNHVIDFEFTPIREGTYRLRDSMFSGTYFAANQSDVVVQSLGDYQQWLADAAAMTPSPAYNQAAYEYSQANDGTAKDQTAIRGWKTIPPAPPPVVNYAPKQEPQSPPA